MDGYFQIICVIVVSASLLAWLACRFRQPVLLGYFLCGVLIGPWGLGIVNQTELLSHISRIGVTLLLFLAGLVLHPKQLGSFFRTAMIVTFGGCFGMWLLLFGILKICGNSFSESLIMGVALMFSSTILAIKLLPTTTLHQKRMGGICIAVLIAQDIIAVIVIMLVGLDGSGSLWWFIPALAGKAVLFVVLVMLAEQYLLRRMMQSVEMFNEVLLMLCLGWCLGVAVLAEHIGLSYEIGAFVAGVAMARWKLSLIFSEQLKPLRDFFLMFFFFVLGAEFDVHLIATVWMQAVVLGVLIVGIRPFFLSWLLRISGEKPEFAKETGFRLGPASEFALIIVVAAVAHGRLSEKSSHLVQFATIITMLISSYIVVFRYPTPIGITSDKKKD